MAIEEIDQLLDADPPKGSSEYERLEFLSVLVEEYEKRHYPLGEDVTPQDAVEFMLEQKGLDRADLRNGLAAEAEFQSSFRASDLSPGIRSRR